MEAVPSPGCPHCAAIDAAVGGGSSIADVRFNFDGACWGYCSLHQIRWTIGEPQPGLNWFLGDGSILPPAVVGVEPQQ